ncbi:MAG: dihydropteroate synthase [Microbacteriaceae bacterium]
MTAPGRGPRRIGGRDFDFERQIAVMAIVNRTPDSFYDRGATDSERRATEAALAAAAAGADWVDIGGVRFAPGPEVPLAEELERVVPVVAAVSAASDVVISVDTFRPEVAAAAVAAGASVVNDTTGLGDPRMAETVAAIGATVVVTHSLAAARTPLPGPAYRDVVDEVRAFLEARVERALAAGIAPERIVVDPGHDLNKSTRHSLELTRRLDEIAALGLPLLVAVSNKDFVGETLGRDRHERLAGTLAAATLCVDRGARILRMHNVAEAVDAARMVEAVMGWRAPAVERHNVAAGHGA